MRKVFRFVRSAGTMWRVTLAVVVLGALATTAAFAFGGSSAPAKSAGSPAPSQGAASTAGEKGTPKANVAANVTNSSYSGGHLLAADPTGGYWTVDPVGGVAAHGAAPSLGSPVLSGLKLSQPIVAMAGTPDGQGYWLTASDGGVFTFGDAHFYGSTGAMQLNQPIVGMAATPDGQGYWLVASDGGIFTFGDAPFLGTLGGPANQVIGLIVSSPSSKYSLVTIDGSDNVPSLTPPAASTTPSAPPGPSTSTTSTTTPGSTVPGRTTPGRTTPSPSPTTTTTTTTPASTSGGGTCNGTSNPTVPTASTYGGYSLQSALTGPQIVSDANSDGYNAYAANSAEELPPSGWIEGSHITVTNNALVEEGYTDPAHPGVTGAGMQIANDRVNSYGGFSYCFSLSGGNWQNVAAVFEAWPADSVWQEGEIDVLAGTPQQPGIDVVQDGGCNATSDPCKVVWQSQWPAGIANGLHEMTVLWNPNTGDSFYLDGKLFASVPPSSSVGIPSTPHIPTMQLQDMAENSSVPASSPLTASLYWVASYSYNQ